MQRQARAGDMSQGPQSTFIPSRDSNADARIPEVTSADQIQPRSTEKMGGFNNDRLSGRQRTAFNKDMADGIGSGNLMKMGFTKLAERHAPDELSQTQNQGPQGPVQGPGQTEQGATAPQILRQGQAPAVKAPGMPQMTAQMTFPGSDQAAVSAPAPAPQIPVMDRNAKIADYNQRIQAFRDEGTLQGELNADLLQKAKNSYMQSRPWKDRQHSRQCDGRRFGSENDGVDPRHANAQNAGQRKQQPRN
jgi:hypothetical protein